MKPEQIWQGVQALAPEVGLTLLVLVVVIADLLAKKSKGIVAGIALGGTLAILAWTVLAYRGLAGDAEAVSLFAGSVTLDRYAMFFKVIFLATTAGVIVFALPQVARWTSGRGEVWALMLSCTLGLCLMASAADLLMMYLALEFVSITSYVLAGFLRKNRKSSEASLKYILYGSAASGLMLYGMSFLYGLTGTLSVAEIGMRMPEGVPQTMTLVVSTLVMAGFGYKIAAAPFHLWCPDVYEGAPTPVTAFFSVGPKAAGFAMLARFLSGVFATGSTSGDVVFPGAPAPFEWRIIVALLAVLTLAVGNFGALQQQNLKRLLAYSSIGHAGVMLLAFSVFTTSNIGAVLFYVAVYAVMNLGAFLVVLLLEEQGIETVDQCRGLGWRSPLIGIVTVIFMLALTGLPPTAGFTGKLLIFGGMVEHGLAKGSDLEIGLAVVGVLFAVVSLFYYARIMGAMYLVRPREGEDAPLRLPLVPASILWLLAGATLWFGLMPGKLAETAFKSAATMSPLIGK